MPNLESINLYRYYERLAKFDVSAEYAVTLADVADTMATSPRHARSVLKQMTELSWIAWLPKVGRNQRSTLIKKLDRSDVKKLIATEWLKQSKYDRALEFLDNDQSTFGQLLQQTAGAQINEGSVHVQLTYNRSFARLAPNVPHRNSERFLVRQVHACLVSMSRDGELKPDIAHHWEADERFRKWSFYIRPSVYFHDGARVNAESIATLLMQLKERDYYRSELDHLESVEVNHALGLTVSLSRSDRGFAALLSDLKYSIQPPQQLEESDLNVVGCGVFSLADQSSSLLNLSANERYHGLRSLTDHVSIWSVSANSQHSNGHRPKNPASCEQALVSGSRVNEQYSKKVITHPEIDLEKEALSSTTSRARIEDGCMFMIFNQEKPSLSFAQRSWLSQMLSGEKVWQQLVRNQDTFGAEFASSFFPFWHNVKRIHNRAVELPRELKIAYYNHPGILRSATAVKQILEAEGIGVTLNLHDFDEFVGKAIREPFDEDIVMSSLNLDDNRQVSALLFFLSDPVLHAGIGDDVSQWLKAELNKIRADCRPEQYLTELEQIGSLLIHEGIVSPMFHHRQTLSFQGILKGVEITTWGWPQIRDVWSAD
ncbi:SgrR family transcriptional regulator [Vibrio maritimus]|uniref:SgrR family transcriptional regulator n=1 Tax=Vibrio maritimus TaxID=990268 RepID=UPI00406792D6